MFAYSDGSSIAVGDVVLHEYGRTEATVELVITTPTEMQDIGVAECGVMLLSPPFGRLYLPELSLQDDPLQFVRRVSAA